MPSIFVLGPSLEVTEPEPGAPPSQMVGRKGIVFASPATEPGGKVHLLWDPKNNPADTPPVAVHAFFVSPPSLVPTGDARTPDWFLKSPHPRGSVNTAHEPPTIDLQVAIMPGVHHLQTILEFTS